MSEVPFKTSTPFKLLKKIKIKKKMTNRFPKTSRNVQGGIMRSPLRWRSKKTRTCFQFTCITVPNGINWKIVLGLSCICWIDFANFCFRTQWSFAKYCPHFSFITLGRSIIVLLNRFFSRIIPIFLCENNTGVSLILFLCHSVHLLTFSKCNNHSHCGLNSHENGSHCWSKMKKKIVVNTCSCWGSTKSNGLLLSETFRKIC